MSYCVLIATGLTITVGVRMTGKVVFLIRSSDTARRDAVLSAKPAGWKLSLVDPDEGEEQIAKELEDAQFLLALGGRVSSEVLKTAKQLKLIQAWGMGTDHLPVRWCIENGIFVANAGGANAIAVAEHTVLLMLACLKRFTAFNHSIREGSFLGTNGNAGSH